MCSFILTNKPINDSDIDTINRISQYRGPDSTNLLHVGDVYGVHNLLSITGRPTRQPLYEKDVLAVFNGEIYNYEKFGDYASDAKCIIDLYQECGPDFARELDGEFAIALYDFKNQKLVIASDPFRTKPLHYAYDGEYFGVATYRSSLKKLGFQNIVEHPPNTITIYCDKPVPTQTARPVYTFNLDQYKDTFDDWIDAFKCAIWKRTRNVRENIFTGLSSGHDSGAIFLEMCLQGVKFMSYSILNNEYKSIVEKRLERHHDNLTYKFHTLDTAIAEGVLLKKVENYVSENYDVKKDPASRGLSSICRKALSGIGHKIYISGAGADEIMSDYSYRGNSVFKGNSCFNGVFPEDLNDIFPWKNFYGGTMKNYLMKEEHVCGAHGIEARYPYLDVKVVQEFLNLKHTLKNSNYKAPLKYYFEQNNFPYHEFKLGFSPFESVK